MLDPFKHPTQIKFLFVILFIAIAIGITSVIVNYLIDWSEALSALYFILTLFVILGISYELAEWISALLVKKRDLPMLSTLSYSPPVAILYLTCNDFNLELATRLKFQVYPNITVFVLDDSTLSDYRMEIEQCGLNIIRRATREFYKAGNINHWLSNYDTKFDYFIVLDNDSLIPNNFVEEMVKYAEHPANHNTAIFQSSVSIWNRNNRFAKILDLARSLRSFVSTRIDNPCEMLFPTTNNLIRMSSIRSIDGFSTKSPTTEDWATGLELIQYGYRCQRVDTQSFVSMSTNVQMHTKRMSRWASGLIEIAKTGIKGVPLTTKLRFFMGIYFYLIWPVYIAALIFVTIWGYNSNWHDLFSWADLILGKNILTTIEMYPLFTFTLFALYFHFLRPLLAHRTGTSLSEYIQFILITTAIGLYAFPTLLKAQFTTLIGGPPERETVNNIEPIAPLLSILKEMRFSIVILGILLIGLIQNPLALVFNFPWLIPFFLAPFTLFLWQQTTDTTTHDSFDSILLTSTSTK